MDSEKKNKENGKEYTELKRVKMKKKQTPWIAR